MNERHESNRRHWNESSGRWEKLRDEDGLWRRCPDEPELGFDAGALGLIREFAGNLRGTPRIWKRMGCLVRWLGQSDRSPVIPSTGTATVTASL